ncbi:MAG: ATP synthase F1 subunit gamma [Cytophagales bacterium]|nr:MAG: ATP synthase F1 subunit gamma [Cytophagales bacterium]
MPSLKEIRNRINSVRSTQQITKAMKMVAAAKLRKAQDAITRMRPYSNMLEGILNNLTESTPKEELNSPFFEVRTPKNVLIITITSDRGLCGAFNANVLKMALQMAQDKYTTQYASGQVTFLAIGNKANDFWRIRKVNYNAEFSTILQQLNFVKVKEAGEYILNAFAKGEYDRVEIVYNEFKNVATQIVRAKQFLPIIAEENTQANAKNTRDYLLEPSKETLITELIPKTLKVKLYSAILDSNASEQGARMMAMDKATENAEELVKQLLLTYNKTRQAAITKEILEIVGGAEALKG